MKWYDRVLLTILSVLGAVFCFCILSVAVGWPLNETALRGIAALCQERILRLVIGVVGLAILAICVRLLWVAIKRSSDFRDSSLLVETTANGQTLVSREAISALVQKHAVENRRIHSAKTTVKAKDGKIELFVQLVVTEETPGAELMRDLQSTIKDCVDKSFGINVDEVHILIKNTSRAVSPRVE